MSGQTVGRLWAQYLEVRESVPRTGASVGQKRGLYPQVDELEERLLVNYAPLVKYVAGKVSARMTGTVDQGDFMSAGLIGLLNAIQTFDPNREAKFETYAISKIRWAILDEARKDDALSRRARSRAKEVEAARRELAQHLHREPKESELAERAGLSIAEYRSLAHQQDRSKTSSLEAQSTEYGGLGLQIADETAENPESSTERGELREELISAMRELSERERTVVTLYFYEGLTLREIGQALQLTEGRISQVLKQTLHKLRRFIGDEHLVSGGFV